MVNEKLLLKNYNPKLFRRLKELGCEFEDVALVDPAEIVVDQGIYPRSSTDTDRVEMYKEDLLKGDQFPPLIVTKKEGKLLLVDGNHRYFAHLKAGVKVPAEIWRIPGHEIRYVATICNVLGRGRAGKDLTGSEKKRGIIYAFSEGINTVMQKLAEDFETTVSYVRKVLSQAGLIRDRKEEMKKRARELKEQGLSSRQIAERLSEEFGERIPDATVRTWLLKNYPGKNSTLESTIGESVTQVRNSPTDTPTVRSTLDDPERLIQEEEEELLAVDAVAEEADGELSLKEKVEEAKRLVREEGLVPAEAYEKAGLPEDWERKDEVIMELAELFYGKTTIGRLKAQEASAAIRKEQNGQKQPKLKSKEDIYKEVLDTINVQLARWESIAGREAVIELLETLLQQWKDGSYTKDPFYRRGRAVYEVEYRR
ncbi:ParB domain protein nuclease [Thermovibrio ammonificans HB-1]|uniref:ParB domain protein nuclease n=1 Tax=Thermovibrio ammonificans (strain DSM 15698 / JCM 12110 / HB-1) TaxID=648996 RepID=E8T2T2_THEA1|nr:ParB N-terminal domain-containing protein [Thermovibrio ammonificans]ADU96007.1 ParB domain protein nuclease [Thermovibrio ammonificans HB-1]